MGGRNKCYPFRNIGRLLCPEIDLLLVVHILSGKHGGTQPPRQESWGPAFVPTSQENNLCSRVGNVVGKSPKPLHFPGEWKQEWVDVTGV